MSWSKKYYKGLTNTQHNINDDWFKNMLRVLKESGILYVPNLDKSFNKKGREVIELSQQQIINETVPYNDIEEANKK